MRQDRDENAIWRERVAKVLGGADYSTLQSRTLDGLDIEPLYAKADHAPAGLCRAEPARPWAIVQRIDHPDATMAAEQAMHDLDGGAGALHVCLEGADAAYGFGLPATGLKSFFRSVPLDGPAITIFAAPGGDDALCADLADILAERRLPPALARLDLALDPCAGAPAALPASMMRLVEAGFDGPLVRASGRPWHNRGATAVQELAAVMSSGIAGLRLMEASGLPLDQAPRRMTLELCADADEFTCIAKFRAARLLWAEVEAACGLEPQPCRLVAETSYRMQTRQDAATNVLRNSLACAAAALGGADAIAILPHSLALGLPDGFARRMARNQHVILIEESHLAAVADPAAGSGAFEALTAQLADRAWALMQRLEQEGGLAASMRSGRWQAEVEAARAAREAAIRTGASHILGTTLYPDAAGKEPAVLVRREGPCAPFDTVRDAAPFEHSGEVAA